MEIGDIKARFYQFALRKRKRIGQYRHFKSIQGWTDERCEFGLEALLQGG
jgi:hypothetical protein